jgi:hypothetical protein
MFKINTDLTNPDATPREFTSTTLFDPRVHQVPSDFYFKTTTFLQFLKNIYTRENLVNNPALFFARAITDFNNTFPISEFLSHIPDDQLWLLNYIVIGRHGRSNQKLIYFQQHDGIDISEWSYTPHIYNVTVYDGNITRSSYPWTDPEFPAWVNTTLHTLLANLQTRIFHNSRLNNTFIRPQYSAHQTVQLLQAYYINEPCIQIDDLFHNRGTLSAFLDQHPTATTTFNFQTGSLSIRNPVTPTNRSPLYRTLNYTASPLHYIDWPITLKNEHKPTLYGVELELSTDYDERTLVDAAKIPFFILKSDSSISGRCRKRYELCTVPMSFKAHRQQWAHWFNNLDYEQFDQTKDTNNGLHVHISKDVFSQEHLRNFIWFFTQPAHHDFMLTVSERDAYSFTQYSQLPRYPNSPGRSYINSLEYIARVRGCITLSNKNTVEVRLFRGIVSLADILKNLEFVDSVFHFTLNNHYHNLTLSNYYKWLLKTPANRYILIKKYLQQLPNLNYIFTSADLHRYIHTERNPDAIIKRLQKAPISLTNTHITILNRIFKKRVFVLDKETNTIKLSQHNRSKLAFLDRELEKRLLSKDAYKPSVSPITPLPDPAVTIGVDPPVTIGVNQDGTMSVEDFQNIQTILYLSNTVQEITSVSNPSIHATEPIF